MYRPYRVGEGGKELAIVFRDHALSDGIGFHYQRNDPVAGAEDFIARLRVIGNAVHGQALVPVILDGENCWEHYPGGGVTFLRNLYERCVRANDLKPVRIDHYLEQNPPRDLLPHLFAGSWINHSFAIWIGHEEVNTAWDVLHQTREHLKQQAQATALSPEQLRRPGRKSTSPRGATGSGGTATIIPAPRTPCLTTCSASTCKTFTCCWAKGRPPS